MNFEVGRDASLDDLRKKHDAVLIATGVYQARDIQAPGSGLDNIVPAMTYLTAPNKHGLGHTVADFASGALDPRGTKVVVIGGSDPAMDCVRKTTRHGDQAGPSLYRPHPDNIAAHTHRGHTPRRHQTASR